MMFYVQVPSFYLLLFRNESTVNQIFHFQKFKIMQLVIEKKLSALKAALFSASNFSKQKILVGSEIYLKKSTK